MSDNRTDRAAPRASDEADASREPAQAGTKPPCHGDADPATKRDDAEEAIERATAVVGSEEPSNHGR